MDHVRYECDCGCFCELHFGWIDRLGHAVFLVALFAKVGAEFSVTDRGLRFAKDGQADYVRALDAVPPLVAMVALDELSDEWTVRWPR